MNGSGGNNRFQGSPGGRRSSSGSSVLNPEATAFNGRQRESLGYPVRPSSYSRSGRAKGRNQPAPFPLSNIPTRPGRQGQHPQQLPIIQGMCSSFSNIPPFIPGPAYNPTFPVLPHPPPLMQFGLPCMPYSPPAPDFQEQGYYGPGLEHHSPDKNRTSHTGERSKAMRRSMASASTKSHSRTESQFSQDGPLTNMTEKMVSDKYRAEFEEARGFEDGSIYVPALFKEHKK
ncbi:hypothetical protein F4782DRAFT_536333 [Xylaria castorea]|nr:hypothetical protein F4782DRAFT_536333 [Xylaria castorea]